MVNCNAVMQMIRHWGSSF